jgi:phosphoglycerol transferase MdoB-like AlkP superfamily enzyme
VPDALRFLRGLAALLLLNACVTFTNVWPTPAVRWDGGVSVEFAVLLLVLSAAVGRRRVSARSTALVRALTVVWLLLTLGRYVDVTAPALWGRELNFYWDLQFLPDVAAMLVGASRSALVLGVGAALGALLLLGLLYVVIRWAVRQVLAALEAPRARLAFRVGSGLAIGVFALQVAGVFGLDYFGDPRRVMPVPVTQVYARQAKLMAQALFRPGTLLPSPPMDASLSAIDEADVFLFFIESYGAVTFDRPEFSARLQPARDVLASAIRDTGRDVVSAFVESPTFGGSSWFAHISLMSGLEINTPDLNALLMTQQRDTVVTAFARRGYRTIALMPGLWYPWPEGAFYGFQDSYNGPRLAYPGPPFGWWDMPDQFTLARLDDAEVAKGSRRPLFVFFPTVSTHTPFSPLAPYQPDWPRMLTREPFDAPDLERALASEPDWFDLRPAYLEAVAYAYRAFAGYVQRRAGRDYVMILIGDHQPPAVVTGEGASWDVPVHIITNRRAVLERLQARGMRQGLTPASPHLGKMHELLPVLLDAFSAK